MRAASRRVSARSGMTLVEVLVAMGILLIGMTAVLGLLTTGAALSRSALQRTSAAAASEAVLEDLEEQLFPLEGGFGGEAGEPEAIEDRALPGAPGVVYSATAVPNPEHPLEYRVDVVMSWQSAGVRRANRFTTILVREVPFGERLRRQFVPARDSAPGDGTAPAAETPK